MNFLGHVVSAEGVQPDPKKCSVIKDWPALNNVHGVQQFLGLGNYFNHYIQGYVQLVAPLRKLMQKAVKLELAGAANDAFEHLKYCLSHAPVLALPDPELSYEVVVDASPFGCGAMLLQKQRPVAFHSVTTDCVQVDVREDGGEIARTSDKLLFQAERIRETRCETPATFSLSPLTCKLRCKPIVLQ